MLSPMSPDQMSEDLKRHNDEHARSSQSNPEQIVTLLGIDPSNLQWAGETAVSIISDLAKQMDDDRGCVVDIQNATSDLTIYQQGFFGGSTTYMLDSFPASGVPPMEQGACGLDKGAGLATGAWGVLAFAMSTEYTLMVLFSVPYWGWTSKNTVGILGLKTEDHPSLKKLSDPANGLWWFNQIYDGLQGKVAKAGNHATLTYEGYDIRITIDGKKDATANIYIQH